MHHKKYFGVVPALFVSIAWGQALPPDGGALRQQLDPPRIPALPALQPRLAAPPEAASAPQAGPSVVVRRFEFTGRSLVDDATLAAAVAPWVGKAVGFAELSNATQAVAEAYRRAGWLARAELPPQDITNGVVRIRITEARFAGAVVEGAATRRLSPDQAKAIVEAAATPGDPLNLDDLDRALLLIDDLPGVSGTLSLRAGTKEGDTQAVVGLADAALVTGSASVDNLGARATGAVRVSGQLSFNSPLGIGDLAGVQLSHSKGSDYVRVAYDLPLGPRGWRVGGNASALDYHVVSPEFAALDAKGPSESAGLQATTPLLRSRSANVYLQLAADRRHFRNSADGAVSSRYDIDALTVAVSGNRLDDFGGGGASAGSLQLVRGRVDLGGSPNEAADASTVRVGGDYTKLHLGANRQQRLDGATTLVVNAQAQWADRNLDGSEKMYLGGPDAVRAYPVDEAGGSRGALLSLELQRSFAIDAMPVFSASAFADIGRVTANVHNRYAGASPTNNETLKGAGLWVATSVPSGPVTTQLRLTWAHRLGDNPGASASGRDQDGSKTLNRFWLTASVAF